MKIDFIKDVYKDKNNNDIPDILEESKNFEFIKDLQKDVFIVNGKTYEKYEDLPANVKNILKKLLNDKDEKTIAQLLNSNEKLTNLMGISNDYYQQDNDEPLNEFKIPPFLLRTLLLLLFFITLFLVLRHYKII